MRPSRKILGTLAPVLMLVSSSGTGWSQTSVATDPIGFVTETVKGGGSVASPQLSLISPTLMQPVDWQGAVGTISGTTINVSGTPWTANQFGTNGQSFVEVITGTNAGAWTDIEASTTSGLTTLDDLSAFASTGSTIRIRKHSTVASFLGATNSVGLQGGTAVASADEVMVYDGSNSKTYWYYDGSDSRGPVGWYDPNFVFSNNAVIPPNAGVVVSRKSSGQVNFLSLGAVKTGNTLVPVRQGPNVIGTVAAKGLTLATSGLFTGSTATGVKGSTSPSGADEVMIFSTNGPTVYWYYDASDGRGAAGWYDATYHSADTVAIVPGSALVLTRKPPGVAFNWTIPSPSTF